MSIGQRTPSRRRAHERALQELAGRERLSLLAQRCRDLHTSEDPATAAELAFRELPYRDVARLALEDVDVRSAMAMLPAGFRWAQ